MRVAAAGVGVALGVGTASVITLWPDTRQVPRPEALSAAEALRAEGALRADLRISRDRAAAPATSAAPSAPATSAPAAPATRAPAAVPAVVGKLWVTTQVNVRSGPSPDDARLGSLEALTQVGVSGVNKDGWIQVVVEGRAGWVKGTYLSRSKPKPKATTPAGVSDAKCTKSTDIEPHLTANARAVYRAVCAAYGSQVSSFGGYRSGDDGDHGSGRALDIMVSGDPGWEIARYVQTHAKDLGVTYVIYQQKMWFTGHALGDWEPMEDRGSSTANHYDHVHVSVS